MPTYKYQLSLEIIHNTELCSQEMTDGNVFISLKKQPSGQEKCFPSPPQNQVFLPKVPQKVDITEKMHGTFHLGDGKAPVN